MRKILLYIMSAVAVVCQSHAAAQDSISVRLPDLRKEAAKDSVDRKEGKDSRVDIQEEPERETAADSLMMTIGLSQSFSWGENAPFWLVNNRQGLSSIRKGSGYLIAGLEKPMDTHKRFSWGAGAEVAVPWDFTSRFVVQQLYGEFHYRSLRIQAGSRNQTSWLCDPWLSSGSLLFSGNARPVPQLKAGIFDFEPIPLTKRWISVKGHLSYGMFTDSAWQKDWVAKNSRYQENVMLCTKGLWLKGGDDSRFPLTGVFGIEMGTQFGGTVYNCDMNGKIMNIKMPTGPKAWWKAFVPLHGDKTTVIGEQRNVEGNTVGAYDMELKWKSRRGWSVRAYAQHMFEDHSMLWIDFPWKDGLLGLQAELPDNPVVSSIVIEYLYSKFQSGPVYNDTTPEVPEQVSGVDLYYNHYIYTGWMHWGMGIGNPFSVSPIYNSDHILKFYATRNISQHIGICGTPHPDVDWRLLLSHTRSWGDYSRPFPEVKTMWNFLAELSWYPESMPGFEWKAALAFDRGNLVGNNFGFMIGLRFDIWTPMSQLRKSL